MKSNAEMKIESGASRQVLAPSNIAATQSASFNGSDPASMLCPNCGSRLEGRKCKLFCLRTGCGYQVTCAEW